MANIIGEIKAYHNGKVYSIADIYDATLSDSNVKGYLKIYHNSKTCYVPLTDNQSLKQTPCFEIYHDAKQYFALQIQSTELKAKISSAVTYGEQGTISITGNTGGGSVSASIPSTYSDCLTVQSTTSSTVVVKCTKYTSSKIPVTVNVAAVGSYSSGTTTVNVTTAKATTSPSVTLSDPITFNTSKSATISGNTDKGTVSVDIPSAYSDYLSATSVATNTFTLKCTKYTDDTIPVTINIAATANYAAASVPLNVKTARASISPSATVSGTITYNSSGTISISGNTGKGNVSLSVSKSNSEYLDFSNVTTNSAVVTCTNYKSSAIPVTVKIDAAGNYNSGTCTVNVTTAKANLNLSANTTTVTYNSTKDITVSGNDGEGTVTASVTNCTDCLTVQSTTTTSVTLKCTKYTSNAVPVKINVAATNNYNSATTTVNISTAKANNTLAFDTTSPVTLTYGVPFTLTATQNLSGGTLSIGDTSSSSTAFKSHISSSVSGNSITLTCTKWDSDYDATSGHYSILGDISSAETANYNSKSVRYAFKLRKAGSSLSANISGAVTYSESKIVSITGNDGGGSVSVTVPNSYSDCLTVSDITSASFKVSCTKYTSATINLTVNVAASSNYSSGTCTVPVTTARKKLSAAQSSFSVSTITYDGTEKSVANYLSGYNSSYHSLSSNTKATDAGTYTVKIAPKANFAFNDGSTAAKSVQWIINPKLLTKPTLSNTSFTFDGDSKAPTVNNFNSTYENKSGTSSATNAGSYTLDFTLKNSTNTTWADGSTGKVSYTWKIDPKRLTKPSLSDTTFTFDGDSKAPTVNNFNSTYENQTGSDTAVKAGTYTLDFTLKDTTNTTWTDSSTGKVSCTWKINQLKLPQPYLTDNTFTYDKQNHSPTVHDFDSNYEYQYGMISASAVDTYTLTYTLKSVTNTAWTDGTTAPVTREWYINKRELTKPSLKDSTYTFDGDSHSPTVLNYDSNYELQAGTDTAVNVGTYSLTYSLRSSDNTSWADGSTAKVTHDWYINKLRLLVPTLTNDTYTFDGTVHAPTVNNFNSKYETQKGTDAATNANTYHLTYSLKDKDNTIWNGLNTNDFVRDWVINPASTGKTPYLSNSTYTYAPNTQREPSINNYDSTTMEINSNSVLKATNAGTYSITFQTKSNYVLPSGDKYVSRDWVINPISINEASLSATHLTYDGSQKSVSLVFPADYYSLVSKGGDLSATNAGAYTYSLNFKDTQNYIWTNRKNSEQLDLVWYVDKANASPSFSVAANDESSGAYQATVFFRYSNTNPTVFTDTSFELVSWSVTWIADQGSNKTWSSTNAGIIQTDVYNAKFKVEWSPNGHSYADFTLIAFHGGLANDNNIFHVQVNLRCSNPNFTNTYEWSVYRVFHIRGANYGGPDVTISNS